ncbi:MAG: succinate dehydrogenase cytochrome b subunit [Gemmatimonadaceae bacterium]
MGVLEFYRSTIGKKLVMAVTGLIMVGFVVGHVSGNLLVFRGRTALNAYAAFLKDTGALLWLVRGLLLASLLLHVVAAVQLTRRDLQARPVGYGRREAQVSTFASRTIRWGGVALLLFIVYHLLHFTTGTLHPSFSRTDVYHNMVAAFQVWWVSAIYVAAMIALGLHLYHGGWAAVRTLGFSKPGENPLRHRVAAVLAVAVWLGFTVIPVAVLAGLVR